MPDIHEFREARLTLGSNRLTFVVEAYIEERWEHFSVPVYRDKATVETYRTLKRMVAKVRRKFHENSPLHAAIDGGGLTLKFISGGETYEFEGAKVIEWKVWGKYGGEMMEEVEIVCEGGS